MWMIHLLEGDRLHLRERGKGMWCLPGRIVIVINKTMAPVALLELVHADGEDHAENEEKGGGGGGLNPCCWAIGSFPSFSL